jgi:hypothetical protein
MAVSRRRAFRGGGKGGEPPAGRGKLAGRQRRDCRTVESAGKLRSDPMVTLDAPANGPGQAFAHHRRIVLVPGKAEEGEVFGPPPAIEARAPVVPDQPVTRGDPEDVAEEGSSGLAGQHGKPCRHLAFVKNAWHVRIGPKPSLFAREQDFTRAEPVEQRPQRAGIRRQDHPSRPAIPDGAGKVADDPVAEIVAEFFVKAERRLGGELTLRPTVAQKAVQFASVVDPAIEYHRKAVGARRQGSTVNASQGCAVAAPAARLTYGTDPECVY